MNTDKLEPNDVDCVLLIGPAFRSDGAAEESLLAGMPFINMEQRIVARSVAVALGVLGRRDAVSPCVPLTLPVLD